MVAARWAELEPEPEPEPDTTAPRLGPARDSGESQRASASAIYLPGCGSGNCRRVAIILTWILAGY